MTNLPSAQNWGQMMTMSADLVRSGFLPESIKTPQQAAAVMLKGQELGIPAMQAFSQICIIKGKPSVSPELMLSLIYARVPGTIINYKANSNELCEIEATRPGHPAQTFTFSKQDAQTASLWGRGAWKTYPRAMLRSRCISEMGRALFPDAISGASYTAEEMGAEVIVEADGQTVVVEAMPEVIEPTPTPREALIEKLKEKYGNVWPMTERLALIETAKGKGIENEELENVTGNTPVAEWTIVNAADLWLYVQRKTNATK